jgi:hypothetical protein
VKKPLFQQCHCVQAEQGGSREAVLPPAGRLFVGLMLRRDMQQIIPLLLCAKCKEILQQRCVSHINGIMGCVVGKLTASGAASV